MGWLFVDNVELSNAAAYDKYVRDLIRDPYYLWLQRGLKWVWVYAIHALAICALGFGVGYLLSGTTNRTVQVGMQFLLSLFSG